jgi:hypothetical protein
MTPPTLVVLDTKKHLLSDVFHYRTCIYRGLGLDRRAVWFDSRRLAWAAPATASVGRLNPTTPDIPGRGSKPGHDALDRSGDDRLWAEIR